MVIDMAIRKIIKIDEDLCNGCGECIVNCHEGALAIVDGKARIVKDSYCDGLGDCIGTCPLGAISIEQREADTFDADAVASHLAGSKEKPHGCPGSAVRRQSCLPLVDEPSQSASAQGEASDGTSANSSQLSHWPVQLALVPPDAPFLRGADLLLVADCVPFAMADFHSRFLRGRPVVVGCPKLDDVRSYIDKLTAIFELSSIDSLTIVHMEVPCCNGLCHIAKAAIEASNSPVRVTDLTVSTDGRVIAENVW
jgi:NAD-dependent dihydropyrimidine dehydrogenase PreA subunit